MRSLNNPSARLEARIALPLRFFLPARFDVRLVVPASKELANVLGVVAFVEADALLLAGGWLRAINGNAVEGRLQEFDVVRVSTAHLNAQRNASSIGEHRSLRSQLTSIRRVFPGFFPLPEATSSSLRPRFANSTGCLVLRRTPATPPSTTCGRRRPPSIPGSNGAACSPNHTRVVLISTGSPCAIRRKCRLRPFSSQHAADRLYGSSDSEATTAASDAKVHREEAKNTASMFSPLKTPPCKRKMSDRSLSVRRLVAISSVIG